MTLPKNNGPVNYKSLILIVKDFPPISGGGAMRWGTNIKYLANYFDSLTVITRDSPHHLIDKNLERDIPENVRIVRISAISDKVLQKKCFRLIRIMFVRIKQLIYLYDIELGWSLKAYFKIRKLLVREKCEILITSSPPVSLHWIGKKLAKKCSLLWISDWRDPWTILQNFYPPKSNIWQHYFEPSLEQQLIKCSDLVVCNTHSMKELFCNRFDNNDNKYLVMPNGYDPKYDQVYRNPAKWPDPCKFVYLGGLRGWHTDEYLLLPFLYLYQKRQDLRDDWRLFLIGDNTKLTELTIIKEMGMNIRITGFLSKTDSAMHLSDANWGLVHLFPTSINQIPQKVYSYIACRLPIISIACTGDLTNLIRQLDAGVLLDPEKKDYNAQLLAELVINHKKNKFGKFYTNDEEIIKYSKSNIINDFSELVIARCSNEN